MFKIVCFVWPVNGLSHEWSISFWNCCASPISHYLNLTRSVSSICHECCLSHSHWMWCEMFINFGEFRDTRSFFNGCVLENSMNHFNRGTPCMSTYQKDLEEDSPMCSLSLSIVGYRNLKLFPIFVLNRFSFSAFQSQRNVKIRF